MSERFESFLIVFYIKICRRPLVQKIQVPFSSSSLCSLSLSSAASWNSTEDEDMLSKSAHKKTNTNNSSSQY